LAYENPKTIAAVLDNVRAQKYVLPAIQREFVWEPLQIARLFDSLMRGYPIGSFLFWKVERERVDDYRYYGFVQDYHEKDNPHCPRIKNLDPNRSVTAVLDGQQRLTALNIALRGSHAEKIPNKWRSNPDAYPKKYLYLNLLDDAPENEAGMIYDFRFLTPETATTKNREKDGEHWYPVREVLDLDPGPKMIAALRERFEEVQGQSPIEMEKEFEPAHQRLFDLHNLVHQKPAIHYYLEEEQDLERVLDIFIRINSGGTVLSYSDLLLSIATAQWKDLSAREVIHELVDELNETREGFDFSKDFVLKAGLMLAGISDVGFKVRNFTKDNMEVLEKKWAGIQRALRLTVRLAANMGFSSKNLSADSTLLPVAYYIYSRALDEGYLTRTSEQKDRERVRSWMIRSLLKTGIWGSGLDTTLKALRSTIAEHGEDGYPVSEIETTMAQRGKSLTFDPDELDGLVEAKRDHKTFGVLALLYPFVDLRNRFHIDHIFPRKAFYKPRLEELGFNEMEIDWLKSSMDQLPNLMLLEGPENQSKQDTMPAEWLREEYESADERARIRQLHDLPEIPEDVRGFAKFYKTRRTKMRKRLERELAASRPDEAEEETPEPTEAPFADVEPADV
jgi:hypothetical protein